MNAIPEIMRGFVLHGHGDFDQFRFHDAWPVPKPGPGQVLICANRPLLCCALTAKKRSGNIVVTME